jgi:hypothetical protein
VALLVTLRKASRFAAELLIDLRLVSLSLKVGNFRLNLNLTWQTRSPASVRGFRHVLNSFLSLLTLFAVLATDFASSSPEPGRCVDGLSCCTCSMISSSELLVESDALFFEWLPPLPPLRLLCHLLYHPPWRTKISDWNLLATGCLTCQEMPGFVGGRATVVSGGEIVLQIHFGLPCCVPLAQKAKRNSSASSRTVLLFRSS